MNKLKGQRHFDVTEILRKAFPGLELVRAVRKAPTDRKAIMTGVCIACHGTASDGQYVTRVRQPLYYLTRERGTTAKARGYITIHKGCIPR